MNTKSFYILLLTLAYNVAFSQSHNQQPTPKTATHVLLEQIMSESDLKNNMVRMETVVFPPSYSSRRTFILAHFLFMCWKVNFCQNSRA